jgi:glucose-6-phosphate dehydrogenase assembly protein OpcA
MTATPQTELLAAPREVDIESIERELTALWKDASPAGTGNATKSGTPPVVRACAMNLIVVTEREGELDILAEMAGEVTIEHPARIFLVLANRQTPAPKLDAWISARCSVPVPGGKQVCCEQINLIALGPEAEKIPSIVTSLLVSDVPSVLLWKAAINDHDTMLQALANVVDRIVIDSSEEQRPEEGLLVWREFIGRRGTHGTFSDLAWTHLTAWRSIVANAFNPPEMRPQLSSIDELAVEYSSTVQPRHSGLSQAFLLVSWCAQKLNWSVVEPLQRNASGEYAATLRREKAAIRATIRPAAPRKGFPGGIESVSLHMADGTALTFSATGHAHCVRLSKVERSASAEEMLTLMSDSTEAQLVAQELEVVARDTGYEAVLHTFSELCRQRHEL